MNYLQKFNQLKTILYRHLLAQDPEKIKEFLDYYLFSKDPEKRQFHYYALELTQEVNTLTSQQKFGMVRVRAAFLKLLAKCMEKPHELLRHRFHKFPNQKQEKFQQKVEEAILAVVDENKEEPLITDEEKKFLFLTANARFFVGDKKIAAVKREVYLEKISLEEANWLIAVALYEKYKKAEHALLKKRQLLEGVLLAYIDNHLTDFIEYKKQLLPQLAPLSVGDYLFYRMSDKALEIEAGSGEAKVGPYSQTLWDELELLRKLHDTVAVPLEERNQPNVFQQEDIRPLVSYDHYLKEHGSIFIREMNTLYRKIKDEKEKQALKSFVKNLNVLDEEVRDWQDKISKLKDLQTSSPDVQNEYISRMQSDMQNTRTQLNAKIMRLKAQAQILFYQGKPSSLSKRILGIGLLFIASAVLTLSLVAFFLSPAGALIAGTVLSYKALAGSLAGLSGMGMLAGGFVTFRSLEKKPATIATVAGNMISFVENKAREALQESKNCEYDGISLLYQ